MITSLLTQSSLRKQDLVLKYLRQKALQAQAGEALPGLRQMMAECRVGQAAIQKAVAQLEQEGLLETSPRRGIFKSAHPMAPADLVRTLDVIYCTDRVQVLERGEALPHFQGTFHGELMSDLAWRCGQRGQGIRVSIVPQGSDRAAFEEVVRRRDCQACVLVLADRPDLETTVFEPWHVPMVHLLPAYSEVVPGSVAHDSRVLIEAQLTHLWALGHRRIGYLHVIDENNSSRRLMARREHYYRWMAQQGVMVSPGWVQFGGGNTEAKMAAMRAMLRAGELPTAVIASDLHLAAVYQVLRERGLEPGADFSVMGTDDLPVAGQMYPPATSLDTQRGMLSQLTLDLLDRKLQGESVCDVVSSPVRVVARQSTGPVKVAAV